MTDEALHQATLALIRLRAGEDDTPVDPACWPTPGQWLARFNAMDPDERLRFIGDVIEDQQKAHDCTTIGHHRERLADQQQDLHTLAAANREFQRLLDEGSEPCRSPKAETPPGRPETSTPSSNASTPGTPGGPETPTT